MVRPFRVWLCSGWHAVFNQGNRGECIVWTDGDRRRFLGGLSKLPERFGAVMQGWWLTSQRLHGAAGHPPVVSVGGRSHGADRALPPGAFGTRHATGSFAGFGTKCQSFGCDPVALGKTIGRPDPSPAWPEESRACAEESPVHPERSGVHSQRSRMPSEPSRVHPEEFQVGLERAGLALNPAWVCPDPSRAPSNQTRM